MDSQIPVHESGARRPLRTWPNVWVWLIALAWLALAVSAKAINFVQDHAVSNILSIVFAANVTLTFLLWFFWFSDYLPSTRRLVFRTLGLTVLLCVALLRPVRTSGDLLPSFRFFWQSTGKETPPLEDLAPPGDDVDLTLTTDHDFHQYLGPRRNMKLAGPELSSDWTTNGPELVWRRPIGAGWSGFVVVGEYAVTMEQREDQELVTCYRRATGEMVWSSGITARHDTLMGGLGPRSTPTIDEGRVYALGATGVLRCLDGKNGAEHWSVNIPESLGVVGSESSEIAWGRSNSPLIVDDLVVIPAGGPAGGAQYSLAAYDKESGERVWLGGDDQISYSSPVVYALRGFRQIISVNEQTVSGHNIRDGRVLWSLKWPGSSAGPANTSQPMRVDDGRLLISKGYNRGAAQVKVSLEMRGEQKREQKAEWKAEFGWQSGKVLKTKLTSVIVHDGHGYGLNDGILQCVDLSDGSLVWKGERLRHGQPLLVGQQLLVMAEWGDLYLYQASPKAGDDRGRIKPLAVYKGAVEGTAWNTLCLSGDLLLVRTDKQAAGYRLPVVQPKNENGLQP